MDMRIGFSHSRCDLRNSYSVFCDKQPKRTTWDSLTAEEKSLFQQEPNAKLIRELERRGIDIQR